MLAADGKKSDSFDSIATAVSTFVARASPDETKTNEARSWCFKHLLAKTAASDKATRAHACQLIGRALHALPEDAEIDDDVYDGIEAALLVRTDDAAAEVRAAAVKALRRLKDSEPVAARLVALLEADAAADVRCAVVAVVGRDPAALPLLVRHARDVAPAVRKLCFATLRAQLPLLLPALGAPALAAVLRAGVSDRDASVVAATTHLLSDWLSQLNDDAAALADALGPVAAAADAEAVVAHLACARLLKRAALGLPCAAATLTPGRALLWRVLLDLAHGRGAVGHRSATECARHRDAAWADDLLPSTRAFCDTLTEVYLRLRAADPAAGPAAAAAAAADSYVLHQLLRGMAHADAQEAAGVARARDFLLDLLEDLTLPADTVALVIAALRCVLPVDAADAGYRAWEAALARRREAAAAAGAAAGSGRAGRIAQAHALAHARFAERMTSSSAIVECLGQVVESVLATLAPGGHPALEAERAVRGETAARAAAAAKAGDAAAAAAAQAELREQSGFEEACWLRLLDVARDVFAHARGAAAATQPALGTLLAQAVRPVLAGALGFRSVAVEAAAVQALGLHVLVDNDAARVKTHLAELVAAARSPVAPVAAAAVRAVGDVLLAFTGLAPLDAADGVEANTEGQPQQQGRLSEAEFSAALVLLEEWAFAPPLAAVAAAAAAAPRDLRLAPDFLLAAVAAPAAAAELSFAATEALCKTLLYDRVPAADTARLLGRLLALMHNSSSSSSDNTANISANSWDSKRKQALTVFFAAYASPQALPAGAVTSDSIAAADTDAAAALWSNPRGVGASDHAAMLAHSVLPLVAASVSDADAGAAAEAPARLTQALQLLLHLVADRTAAPAVRNTLPARPAGAVVFAKSHYNLALAGTPAAAVTPLAVLAAEVALAAQALQPTAPSVAAALARALCVLSADHPDLSPAAAAAATPAVAAACRAAGVDAAARTAMSRGLLVRALKAAPVAAAAADELAADVAAAARAEGPGKALGGWLDAAVESRQEAAAAEVEQMAEALKAADADAGETKRGRGARSARAN